LVITKTVSPDYLVVDSDSVGILSRIDPRGYFASENSLINLRGFGRPERTCPTRRAKVGDAGYSQSALAKI
jgi:hypothetical protein